MLIYLCGSPLNASLVGETGRCRGAVSEEVSACSSGGQGILIAAWAVGAEVLLNKLLSERASDSDNILHH